MSTYGREDAVALLAGPTDTSGDATAAASHDHDHAAAAHASSDAEPAAAATLADLPPELLDHILSHVPPRQRQRAALALAQVLRHHSPDTRHVWAHMPVSGARQVMPLWRRLMAEQTKARGGGAAVVKTFGMVSSRVRGARSAPRGERMDIMGAEVTRALGGAEVCDVMRRRHSAHRPAHWHESHAPRTPRVT